MNELVAILDFAKAHPNVVALFIFYWVFMAAVSGMPAPTNKSGTAYIWAYRSLHALSANLDRFHSGTAPQKANIS